MTELAPRIEELGFRERRTAAEQSDGVLLNRLPPEVAFPALEAEAAR